MSASLKSPISDLQFPGVTFNVVAGRGIAGNVAVTKPNPFGRLRCKLGYLVPRDWTDAQHAAALRVAAHWFRDIGGFALLNHAKLAHILQRLKEGYSEEGMHWAIGAYSASDWHRKNKSWKSIGRFFSKEGDFEAWRDKSSEWSAYVRRQESAARGPCATALEQCSPLQFAPLGPSLIPVPAGQSAIHNPQSAIGDVAALDGETLRTAYRQVLDARLQFAAARKVYELDRARIERTAYEAMPAEEQSRLYKSVEIAFAKGPPRADGTPRADPGSEEFRTALHRRAWLSMAQRGAGNAKRFAYPPAPLFTCSPDHLLCEAEAKRRALKGFVYPRTPRSEWPPGLAASVKDAEDELINVWLNGEDHE